MARMFCEFPTDFLWGTATSSYQIEGGARQDGRTPSVWDTFARRPGVIAENQTGDVACDHYNRYKQDVALMKSLGIKAYRFSVSWSRVIPDESGRVNPKGLDFYSRLVDELRAADIEPWMTLFHWDLPQWAEDKFRGWESKACADAFADYAAHMAKRLGDRVAGVFTINEFRCFIDCAYGKAKESEHFAPGKEVSRKVLNQARHHAVYAHGLAVQAIRAASPKPVPVGLAENPPNVVPVLETPEHVSAAREALRELTGMFLTPIFEGRYHPAYLEDQGADAPTFTDEEMRVINTPLDFLGLNLYAPHYVHHDPSAKRGWSAVPFEADYPRMHMPWLFVGPSILYWGPRLVSEIWKVPAIYITESGCAADDKLTEDRQVLDTGRVMYLQQHLIQAHRAVTEGYPLKGYFLWSLLDNFEWLWGYSRRFGICYVDYKSQERIPKLSAGFYSEVIRRNAVGEAGKM
jgi:beta-glucosidase